MNPPTHGLDIHSFAENCQEAARYASEGNVNQAVYRLIRALEDARDAGKMAGLYLQTNDISSERVTAHD